MSSYNQLIEKLDQFTRKYYTNQVLRGSLYSIGLLGSVFLLYSVAEHYAYFGTGIRTFFLFSFIGLLLGSLGYWVIRPLTKYFKLGKRISHDQAASIIGAHFTSVEDKLLNVLQLHDDLSTRPEQQQALLLASIEQKTDDIKLVPFKQAIDFNENKKYIKYAAPPALIIFGLMLASPSLLKDSTGRILQNNKEFERPAPFHFKLDNQDLTVLQYQNLTVRTHTEGDIIPADAFIEIDGYQYKMTETSKNNFEYTLENIAADRSFVFTHGGVRSTPYDITVLPMPSVADFTMQLDYPGYTGKRDETVENSGNAIVPEGTYISWSFDTESTEQMDIRVGTAALESFEKDKDAFQIKKRFLSDTPYAIYLSNQHVMLADSLTYNIRVIPDEYPSIQVEHFADTTAGTMQYFAGDARDDYGISALKFHTIIYDKLNKEKSKTSIDIDRATGASTSYEHQLDIEQLTLDGGDRVEFYFEVLDNDRVHGAKSAKTRVMSYRKPDVSELIAEQEKNSEEIKEDLSSSLEELRKLQEEMQKLREKLLQQKDVDWQSQQKMQQMAEKRDELMKQIQQAQQQFQENLQMQEQMQEPSEQMQEKQEKLEQLYEEMLSEEEKEKWDELEDLMEKLNKEQALDELEKMEMSNDELEMELDRMLELYKNLEIEHELEKMADALEELAKEQEELAEETEQKEDGDADNKEQQEKQEEIEKKLEDLQEKMEDIQEKNEELEKPKDIDEHKEDMDSAQQDMENSQEQMQKQENKKASKSQKNAAEKMKQMAQQMQGAMQAGQMEQMQEDMETLRQLLENLVELSFSQEDLISALNRAKINTPYYVERVQDQFKMQDDFRMVEDTLVALAKRNDKIESFVMEKVLDIKTEFKKSLSELEERRKSQASNYQQRAMKNLNDLALMLSETMEQMQQAMASGIPGNQSCEKPGGEGQKSGKPSDKMSQGQQGLNQDMKKLSDKMKNGYEGSAEDFGKLAQRQAAIREALRKLNNAQRESGEGDGGELQKLIDEMNKTEIDLVNKNLTNEMMKRQQEILTRLLKAEKAERQKEQDNKRKSQTAQDIPREMPPEMIEYLKNRKGQIEDFNKVSPALRPFYKQLVEEYVKRSRAK